MDHNPYMTLKGIAEFEKAIFNLITNNKSVDDITTAILRQFPLKRPLDFQSIFIHLLNYNEKFWGISSLIVEVAMQLCERSKLLGYPAQKSESISAIWLLLKKNAISFPSRSAVKSIDLLKEFHKCGFIEKDEVVEIAVAVISSVRCLRDPSDILKNILHILEVFSTSFSPKKMSNAGRGCILEYASVMCYMLEGEELSEESQRDVQLILEVLCVKETEIVKPNNHVHYYFQGVISKLLRRQKVDAHSIDIGNIKLEAERFFQQIFAHSLQLSHMDKIQDILEVLRSLLRFIGGHKAKLFIEEFIGLCENLIETSNWKTPAEDISLAVLLVLEAERTGLTIHRVKTLLQNIKNLSDKPQALLEYDGAFEQILAVRVKIDSEDESVKTRSLRTKYFREYLQGMKNIPAMLLTIPSDKEEVKEWCSMLFDKGVERPDLSPRVVEHCLLIVNKSGSDFKLPNLRKLFEDKMNDKIYVSLYEINEGNNSERRRKIAEAEKWFNHLLSSTIILPNGLMNIIRITSELANHDGNYYAFLWLLSFTTSTFKFLQSANLEGIKFDEPVCTITKNIQTLFHKNKNIQTEQMLGERDRVITLLESLLTLDKSKTSKSSQDISPAEPTAPEPAIPDKTVLQLFENFFQSDDTSNDCKLKEIVSKFKSEAGDVRKLSKLFCECEKDLKNIAHLAQKIDELLKCDNASSIVYNDLSFKEALVATQHEAFKKLPKFNEITDNEDFEKADSVVRLTGELYNLDWIDESKLFNCMYKLTENSFATDHQLKMFQSLLKIVSDEMYQKEHVGKCKFYLEMLVLSNEDQSQENRIRCVEILNQILGGKIEWTIGVVAQPETGQRKIQVVFDVLTNENLKEHAKLISESMSTDVLEIMMKAACKKPKMFSKLGTEVHSILPSFKKLLVEKCQEDLLIYTKNEAPQLYGFISFVAEIYNADLIPNSFINLCFKMLLELQTSTTEPIDCISVLIIKSGAKIEVDCHERFAKYFEYFEYVISQKENCYQAKLCRFMIELHKNNWNCTEIISVPMIDHLLYQLSPTKFTSIGLKLKRVTEDSEVMALTVVKKLWEIVIQKPESIQLCAQVLEVIIKENESEMMKDVLKQFLQARNTTFTSIPADQYNEKIARRLGQVFIFIGESFNREVLSSEAVELWLKDDLINHLSTKHAASFSSIVRDKVAESTNLKLKTQFSSLDMAGSTNPYGRKNVHF